MKTKTLKFNKEGDKWYIDFPEYPFNKENLLMVANADKILDILAQGKNTVKVTIVYGRRIKDEEALIYKKDKSKLSFGATYVMTDDNKYFKDVIYMTNIDDILDIKDFWLCPVTLLVLKGYPKYIGIKFE